MGKPGTGGTSSVPDLRPSTSLTSWHGCVSTAVTVIILLQFNVLTSYHWIFFHFFSESKRLLYSDWCNFKVPCQLDSWQERRDSWCPGFLWRMTSARKFQMMTTVPCVLWEQHSSAPLESIPPAYLWVGTKQLSPVLAPGCHRVERECSSERLRNVWLSCLLLFFSFVTKQFQKLLF